jgi:hypothetical protein
MEAILTKIQDTEAKIVTAEKNGDTAWRNSLQNTLTELYHILSQQQQPGNHPFHLLHLYFDLYLTSISYLI